MKRTIRCLLAVALTAGLCSCAAMGDAYIETRPYVRASVDDANFEARNYTTVTGSIGVEPKTGEHIVSVSADRSEGWQSVTKWIAGLFGVLGLGK